MLINGRMIIGKTEPESMVCLPDISVPPAIACLDSPGSVGEAERGFRCTCEIRNLRAGAVSSCRVQAVPACTNDGERGRRGSSGEGCTAQHGC